MSMLACRTNLYFERLRIVMHCPNNWSEFDRLRTSSHKDEDRLPLVIVAGSKPAMR